MYVFKSSKSNKKSSMQKASRKVHTRSYKHIQKRKKDAYNILRKYSSRDRGHGRKKQEKTTKIKAFIGRALGITAGFAVVSIVIVGIVGASWVAQVSASLPQPGRLIDRHVDESTKIYSKDGKLLYTIYADENREFVPIEDIPEHTKMALLAAEDAEFYEHEGIDLPGITAALYANVFNTRQDGGVRGASTITQQLVRNAILQEVLGEEAFERSYKRKLMEILVTLQVEKTFTKEEILEMYMNEINLGGVNYGYQTASQSYFGKDASELTIAESALLAGLIQRPSSYSPIWGTNPEQAEIRKDYVLDQLEEKEELFKIPKEDIEAAREQEIKYVQKKTDIKAPHFVFYVREELVDRFGEDLVERGGLRVTTSLDYEVQQIAEEEVRAMVDSSRHRYNTNNGAMVAINPKTGEIVSMVGSYDYWASGDERIDGTVNITTSLRQPGSSIKPVTYLAGFESGKAYPGMVLYNIPQIKLGVGNWDGGYRGLQSARSSLANSENVSAVEMYHIIGGKDPFLNMAERLGITTFTTPDRYGPSVTLGAAETKLVEQTNMFATFANNGKKMPITSILKVERVGRDNPEVIYEYNPAEEGEQVVSEQAVYLLNDVLGDFSVKARRLSPEQYTAAGQQLAGKTGTTNEFRDISGFLYYPRLAVGFWGGNNNNEKQVGPGGVAWSTTVPLPAANAFMRRVVPIFGKESFQRPGGIVTASVCQKSGLLATAACSGDVSTDVFIKGKTPPSDNTYKILQVCKDTGIISTNPAEAAKFGVLTEIKTVRLNAHISSWQSGLDAYLASSNLLGPKDSGPCQLPLGGGNAPAVTITSPSAGTTYNAGDTISVAATVATLNGLQSVTIQFDGVDMGAYGASGAAFAGSFAIPSDATTGAHSVTLVAKDVDGKTGSKSVSINVQNGASVGISMTSPASGGSYSGTVTLSAAISGDASSVTGVTFYVEDSVGTVVYTASGTQSGGGWNASWTGGSTGSYKAYAVANYSGTSTTSGKVSFSIP